MAAREALTVAFMKKKKMFSNLERLGPDGWAFFFYILYRNPTGDIRIRIFGPVPTRQPRGDLPPPVNREGGKARGLFGKASSSRSNFISGPPVARRVFVITNGRSLFKFPFVHLE